MHLHLLRHAQSMGNLTEDYSTNTHDQLSPKGHQQAQDLIARLRDLPLTHLYCSPMKRTLETIAPFVAHTQKPVCILPDLTEACWGSCSRSEPETPPEYIPTDILKDFAGLPFHFADNKPLRPVEPESFATGLRRIRNLIELFQTKHGPDDHVLCVSHGHALSRLVALLFDLPPEEQFYHNNTGLTHLHLDTPHPKLFYFNRLS